MTTRIYYAESGGYNTTLANNISGHFTSIIIQNEMEYVDVIESPHKIISPVFGLILLIILISFLILVAKLMNDSVPNNLISTYIMKHRYAEKYYVGKTNNIARRMIEHTKDHWSNYTLIWSVQGDYEMNIKSFGIRKFINCVQGGSTLS
jgi:hypothetical protein